MKKAAIEMQFNWIFILIIGGLILTFFIVLVQKQKEVSDTTINIDLRRNMRTILTGAKITPGTTSLINLPNTEIRYDCEGFSFSGLSPVKMGIMFSPSLVKGSSLTISSQRFSMPYTADGVLFVTSSNIRYILVNSSGKLAITLNKSLPPRTVIENDRQKLLFNKEIVSLENDDIQPEITDKNNLKVKFVFFNYNADQLNALNNLGSMANRDVTAVNVIPDSSCAGQIDCFGEIKFYNKQTGNTFALEDTTYYLGEASLLGAVFSDDFETYNCNMREIFRKFSLTTEVYLNRTKTLSNYYLDKSNDKCRAVINGGISSLQNIKTNSDLLIDNFPSQIEISNIYTATQNLRISNEQAIKLSCSEIY